MNSLAIALFCLLPIVFCWDFPGYPGVDCPTAVEKIRNSDKVGWMVPKCHPDGTFQALQCFEQYPDNPDSCMCVAADGSPHTLPGFGSNIKFCGCIMATYAADEDPNADVPECGEGGYYTPLQCSRTSGECWCVSRTGDILVPQSKNVRSCED